MSDNSRPHPSRNAADRAWAGRLCAGNRRTTMKPGLQTRRAGAQVADCIFFSDHTSSFCPFPGVDPPGIPSPFRPPAGSRTTERLWSFAEGREVQCQSKAAVAWQAQQSPENPGRRSKRSDVPGWQLSDVFATNSPPHNLRSLFFVTTVEWFQKTDFEKVLAQMVSI